MKGRIFLKAMRLIGVPRHLEARLYSLSRMMMTWVRIKYATPSQPMTVNAKTIVQKLAVRVSTSTDISST